MYCSFCGKQLTGTEQFCPYCGNKAKEVTPLTTGESILPSQPPVFQQQPTQAFTPAPALAAAPAPMVTLDNSPETLKSLKRAGWTFSLASVTGQLGATIIVLLCSFFIRLFFNLSEETEDMIFNYLAFSTQIVFIIFIIVYLAVTKTTPVQVGFRKPAPKTLWVGILLGLGIIFVSNIPETIFDAFLELLGYNMESGDVTAGISFEGGLFWLAMFTLAVLPAIGEEFIFRGIILENTKKLGTVQACLLNGLLFSLFHANPAQTGYTFIMGAVWALIAIRCNSVLPTMISHFLNNAYGVIMLYLMSVYGEEAVYGGLESASGFIMIAAITFVIVGLVYFTEKNKNGNQPKTASSKVFWIAALLGIIFNAVIWIFQFADGLMA
ncbi:MAG: CPBP family intramembrane metalloprotease [Clostridia bacterium]|nr:CPBP family intramembrane metalloprotease [Clostridia bacterium]